MHGNENEPGRTPETLAQQPLFVRSLNALEQHGKALAIGFSTVTLVLAMLANPQLVRSESQKSIVSTADNNPATVNLGPGLETVGEDKLVAAAIGGIILLGLGLGIVNHENHRNDQ
jgi:hypothetical protein